MKKRKNDLLLGLTALAMAALFIATVLFLAPGLRKPTRPIVVHFPHEDGLAPLKFGSQVLLSGAIEVGHVTRAEPAQLGGKTVVVVTAEVEQSLPLYEDCQLTTDMPLVGGTGTLVILKVGTPGRPLAPGQVVAGLPPQGMAAFSSLSRRLAGPDGLVERLNQMLDPDVENSLLARILLSLEDVNRITATLRDQLTVAEQKTLLAKVHLILDDLNATTSAVRGQMQPDQAASLAGKLHVVLDHVDDSLKQVLLLVQETRPAVQSTLTSLAHAAAVVDTDIIGRLKPEFDPTATGSLLSKLHQSMDRVDAALTDLQAVTDAGRRVLVLNRPKIEQMIANLNETSATLRDGVRDLSQNPQRLLLGAPQPASKRAILTAAHDFAQAATEIDYAAARLQAILELRPEQHVPQSDQEVREIYESLRGAFDRYRQAEEFFWKQMK